MILQAGWGAALVCTLSACAACGGCGHKEEKVGTVVGPPLQIAPPAESSSPDVTPVPSGPPITATFIDLSASGAPLTVRACEQIVVSVVKGKASALGDSLAEGDFLVTTGQGPFTVQGSGLAVVAAVRTDPCTPPAEKDPKLALGHTTTRAATASELTWAGGKMHAHLDVEKDLTGAYAGRLAGSVPMPEHLHEGTWEIFCANDANGTFLLDGQPKHLGPRQVLVIPPSTKHAFTPDQGSSFSGVQFYWPRGPEQRFRELDRKEHPTKPQKSR